MKARIRPGCSDSDGNARSSSRWAVILAGGDGKRLLPLTRKITGDDRPKQFCSVLEGDTLLGQTRDRVRRMVSPRRTLVVVTRTHERFYADQVTSLHSLSVLVQPCNRGTTPAIIYGLMRIRELDPRAIVGFFPSDHHFSDHEALVTNINTAFETAESKSELVVLLGITPNHPEIEYGWIEPGARLVRHAPVFYVNHFWEKPSYALASALMSRGWLWNSFVMIGRVDSFLNLIRRPLPDLVRSFESIREAFFTGAEREALIDLYSGIPVSNFSDEVLSKRPGDFAVLSAGNLGWSDLGDSARVLSVLERKGVRPEWSAERARKSLTRVARASLSEDRLFLA